MTTPDATDDDATSEEVPVATTEENLGDDVTKPTSTSDDVTTEKVPIASTEDDVTTEEAPIATTEDDVTKLPSTSDDNTTKPVVTTNSTVGNSIEDASNAGCKDLIEIFEAKEGQLKKYYKNGHATKVVVLKKL